MSFCVPSLLILKFGTSEEDEHTTSNLYHLGPNFSCVVCVGASHKHHSHISIVFLMSVCISLNAGCRKRTLEHILELTCLLPPTLHLSCS